MRQNSSDIPLTPPPRLRAVYARVLVQTAFAMGLQVAFVTSHAEVGTAATPTATPHPDPRAAQEAIQARDRQMTALNSAALWTNFYTYSCISGSEDNCKPYWDEPCGCAYLAKR